MTTTPPGGPFPEPARPPAPAPPSGRDRNGMATAGFVVALAGLVFAFFPILGFVVVLPALALAITGYRRAKTGLRATPGKSVPAIVLASVGIVICLAMTTLVLASGPTVAGPATSVSAPAASASRPAPAALPAPAPVSLAVPSSVGHSDGEARQALRAAGFTNVQIGPSTGSFTGVGLGTVTTQRPAAGTTASATDPITLGEADSPPPPAAPPALAVPPPPAAPPALAAPPPPAAPPALAAPDPSSSGNSPAPGSGNGYTNVDGNQCPPR